MLVYTPETVSGGADEMGFTVTDGIFTHMDRLEFTMDVTKSEGPRMTVNRGLQLPAGERGGRGGRRNCWICNVLIKGLSRLRRVRKVLKALKMC